MDSYMREVAVAYRTCQSPVSDEKTFKTRTLSATSRVSRQSSSNTLASLSKPRPSTTQTLVRIDKPKKLLDARELLLFEYRFYYGMDDRFHFRAESPTKISASPVTNPIYVFNNDTACRQLYRSSTQRPRYRVFHRGIRINSA